MSNHLSVHSSLSFLNNGSLVHSDIVHDDTWSGYLVTDKARFLKKPLAACIWPNGPKSDPKLVFFPPFSQVWLTLATMSIICRGNIHEKNLWAQIWAKDFEVRAETRFWPFLKFDSLVFLESTYNDSLQHCIKSSKDKTHTKNWGPKLGQNQAQNQVFCHFLKFGSLVFL